MRDVPLVVRCLDADYQGPAPAAAGDIAQGIGDVALERASPGVLTDQRVVNVDARPVVHAAELEYYPPPVQDEGT